MDKFLVGQIIDISENDLTLKKVRGFLTVYKDKIKIGEVPIGDIQAVIFNNPKLLYSHQLIITLAEHNIPIIFCNNKHLPISMVMPFDNYFHQSRRELLQIQAKKPLNKSMWKDIVKSKITQQYLLLKKLNKNYEKLQSLVKKVKSDDVSNCEGQAARFYFKELFGKEFLRRREFDGINALLNYGYIVFRSAVARSVVTAGLSPSIGIKHSNPNNSMPLVDDLIEPFRSFVDSEVYKIIEDSSDLELTKDIKTRLVNSLSIPVVADNITTTPNQLMYKLSNSLGRIYHDKEKKLYLPKMFE